MSMDRFAVVGEIFGEMEAEKTARRQRRGRLNLCCLFSVKDYSSAPQPSHRVPLISA